MRSRLLPTPDLKKLYLAEVVITDYLRQVEDLDVPVGTDPKLDIQRDRLRIFLHKMEEETLRRYREPLPHRFRTGDLNDPALREAQLDGYKTVTQKEIDDGAAPTYPDGTVYKVADPNPETMDDGLLFALRTVVAKVAEHETERPTRHLVVKTQGNTREEYVQNERPRTLYAPLRPYDATVIWF